MVTLKKINFFLLLLFFGFVKNLNTMGHFNELKEFLEKHDKERIDFIQKQIEAMNFNEIKLNQEILELQKIKEKDDQVCKLQKKLNQTVFFRAQCENILKLINQTTCNFEGVVGKDKLSAESLKKDIDFVESCTFIFSKKISQEAQSKIIEYANKVLSEENSTFFDVDLPPLINDDFNVENKNRLSQGLNDKDWRNFINKFKINESNTFE